MLGRFADLAGDEIDKQVNSLIEKQRLWINTTLFDFIQLILKAVNVCLKIIQKKNYSNFLNLFRVKL
jgi:hypothetical protein